MIGLESSEFSQDFRKPNTVLALARFDPDLLLVINRRQECFQVMRKLNRVRSYFMEGFGNLHYFYTDLIYVTDWTEGLLGSDDPWPIVEHLASRDMIRHPRLERDIREQVQANVERNDARVREDYRHAFRSNRRQILRASEKIYNAV